MRRAGVIIAGTFVLALAVAAPSSATHLTLHGCASVKPSASLRANSVKANYRCSSARTALRQLLRHGVSKLPNSKLRPRHWGCLKLAPTWYCTRLGTTPKATKRITFQVKKVENSGLPKPPPPPPPPPPSDVERCIGLWNADTSNASNLG